MENNSFHQELLQRIQDLEQRESELAPLLALKDRETQMRALIETIPDLVWLKDPLGVYLACNRKFENFFGALEQNIVGKTDYDFVNRELADFFRKNDLQAIQNGKPSVNEEEIVFASDGHKELVETIKTPMYDADNKLIGVLGIARDITERNRIERELKFVEERLQLALEVANIGIWDWQIKTDVWYASPTYYTMLGYEPVTGHSDRDEWLNRIHPEDRDGVVEKINSILEAKTNEYRYEARMRSVDGSYRWHSVVGHVLARDDAFLPTHITGLRIDIDARVKAEAEREKLRIQLVQAQKMEAIGRLAGGVAHDFNNMLSVILGHSDLLLENMTEADPTFRALHSIKRAAEKSANLTRQLLAFARKQDISPRVVNLNEVVDNMISMLQRIIGENIQLIWSPDAALWSINMDAGQIDQILANLCVNARDSIAGVGKIILATENIVLSPGYCQTHPGLVPGAYVKLTVTDTGCGIPKEILDKIFEPFFTTKEDGKGTGLGLATVYGIVTQNNGLIDVHSELGYGSAFEIYLPRHHAPSEPLLQSQESYITMGTETILLVEDNTEILAVCRTMLEKQGYTVLASSACEQALQLAATHADTINLLVTDVIMPNMNGKDLFEQLQQHCPNLKVLFMSGYADNVISPHGHLEDGLHFLQKPFSMQQLSMKVRATLTNDEAKTTRE